MAEGTREKIASGAASLLRHLALINDAMVEIADVLRRNSAVREVMTRGCDIRSYGDEFRHPGEPFYCFEAYVEVETTSGDWISWLLDLSCRPTGWELTRSIGKRVRDGGDVLVEFPDVGAADFEAMQRSLPAALEEFSKSAKTFDFVRVQ